MNDQETINRESEFTYGHARNEKLGTDDVIILATDLNTNATYHWIYKRSLIDSQSPVNLGNYAIEIANGLRVINDPALAHLTEEQKAGHLGFDKVLPYVASTKTYKMGVHSTGHNAIYIAVDYRGADTAVRLVGTTHLDTVEEAVGDMFQAAYSTAISIGHVKIDTKTERLTLMDVMTPGTRVTYNGSNATPKKKKRKKRNR